MRNWRTAPRQLLSRAEFDVEDAGADARAPHLGGGHAGATTLDEPILTTLMRDVRLIGSNLRAVVLPGADRLHPKRALRQWDLWGPSFFVIVLAILLSYSMRHHKSRVFAVVFATLSVGAVVNTVNVILLGGNIVFLQSLCLLGYCIFPLDIAAFLCLFTTSKILSTVIVLACFSWSCWSAFPFVGSSVPPAKRLLALYPVRPYPVRRASIASARRPRALTARPPPIWIAGVAPVPERELADAAPVLRRRWWWPPVPEGPSFIDRGGRDAHRRARSRERRSTCNSKQCTNL